MQRLADVCTIKPPKSEARNTLSSTDLVSFAPMEALGIDQKFLVSTQVRNLEEVAGSYTYFADGDVLLAKITPCFENGKLGIARGLTNGVGFGSSEYIVFRSDESLLNDYLYYFLSRKTFRKEGMQRMSGAVGHKRVSKEFIEGYEIPLPPICEQQRIVTILDKAFESIATARTNAEKNLQNARALFESHLQSIFIQSGNDWAENKLGALTTKIGSGATPRGGGESYKVEGISLIRSLNVYDFGFRYPKLVFLDKAQADALANVTVQSGDILLNITGASVARCCIVPENILPARVNQHVSIIRPIANTVDVSFLHYLLISKPYKDQLLQTGSEGGSTRQAITKTQIQDFSIKYPSTLTEQKAIVEKLDAMLVETKCLESIYQQKIAALDELKKSLLHQAFSGELTKHFNTATVIPFPQAKNDIEHIELHAGLLAIAYQRHQVAGRTKLFHHVKAEKIVHMTEAYLGIELGRKPIKDAAGPSDKQHRLDAENWADENGFFSFKQIDGGAYDFKKLPKFEVLVAQTKQTLGDRCADFDRLVQLMLPMDMHTSELFATVYAAWNNLLLQQKPAGDEEIVWEARENWHPKKLKIERSEFFDMIAWIKQNDVIPQGRGKLISLKADPGELLAGLDS